MKWIGRLGPAGSGGIFKFFLPMRKTSYVSCSIRLDDISFPLAQSLAPSFNSLLVPFLSLPLPFLSLSLSSSLFSLFFELCLNNSSLQQNPGEGGRSGEKGERIGERERERRDKWGWECCAADRLKRKANKWTKLGALSF